LGPNKPPSWPHVNVTVGFDQEPRSGQSVVGCDIENGISIGGQRERSLFDRESFDIAHGELERSNRRLACRRNGSDPGVEHAPLDARDHELSRADAQAISLCDAAAAASAKSINGAI